MYCCSELHVGQKHVLTVFFLYCVETANFLFSNVNNGHYHKLHSYYVTHILY